MFKNQSKLLFIYFLFLFSAYTSVAQQEGVKFEKGYSFEQIKELAKKENKYIFIDAYTTWCLPCKEMEIEIFPQKNVGEYFNSNFINVKFQMDTSKTDNDNIKKTYSDANQIKQLYKINAYPTYLFLNPEGVLVHRILGSSKDPNEFITKAKEATHPATQYLLLTKEFENGRRDTTFLKELIRLSKSTNDSKNTANYIQNYLEAQPDKMTSSNIRLIAESVYSTNDIGYDILLNYPKQVDQVIGSSWRTSKISSIAFDEYILPLVRHDGKKVDYGGGMSVYSGEINKNVDWDAMYKMLKPKLNQNTERVLTDAKIKYYKWNNDCENFNKVMVDYVKQQKDTDVQLISNQLKYFLSNCKEERFYNDALTWSKVAEHQKEGLINYSLLLYSSGKKDEALALLEYGEKLKIDSQEKISSLKEKIKSGTEIKGSL